MLPDASLKTLSNGARILVSPMHWSEITTIVVAFRAGSRGEKASRRGLAHFTEHLLFKGSEKNPTPHEMNERVSEIGGYLNASTNIEYTYYIMQVDKKYAEGALDYLADMTMHPRILKDEFAAERDVVIDEMLMSHQDDTAHAEILFEDMLYEHQPLGWDIIGTKKTLARLGPQDVIDWMKTWYIGSNAAVMLVGGGDLHRLGQKAATLFEELPSGHSPAWKPFRRHILRSSKVRHLQRDEALTTMMIGYPTPGFKSPMAEPLRLASAVLGNILTSRLYERVREKEGLAYDISTLTELYSDAGHIAAYTQAPTAMVDRTLKATLEEFHRFVVDPITQKEFEEAMALRLAHLKSLTEDQETLVKHYMKDLFLMRRLRSIEEILEATQSVSLEHTRHVVKKTFVPKRWYLASIGAKKPQIPKGL